MILSYKVTLYVWKVVEDSSMIMLENIAITYLSCNKDIVYVIATTNQDDQ